MLNPVNNLVFSLAIAATSLVGAIGYVQEAIGQVRVDDLSLTAAVSPRNLTCPFTDEQLELQRGINTGRLVPEAAQAAASGRIALTTHEMNEWLSARHRIEALDTPSVRVAVDGTRWKVFVAIFDGTWNDKDDPSLPITVPVNSEWHSPTFHYQWITRTARCTKTS
jgi:hypothetical protein